jgi:hypothetical protein
MRQWSDAMTAFSFREAVCRSDIVLWFSLLKRMRWLEVPSGVKKVITRNEVPWQVDHQQVTELLPRCGEIVQESLLRCVVTLFEDTGLFCFKEPVLDRWA